VHKSTVTDFRTKSHKRWLRHMSLQVIFLGILIFVFEYYHRHPQCLWSAQS